MDQRRRQDRLLKRAYRAERTRCGKAGCCHLIAPADRLSSAASQHDDRRGTCGSLEAHQEFDAVDAACAKLLTTELQGKVMDECLQFFGGWGYMLEYPIARAFVDARMTRLGGGAAEVMRQIIANCILPRVKRPL
jgi:alkylation response protein AidB-like acyl-CoA dehydrogenase